MNIFPLFCNNKQYKTIIKEEEKYEGNRSCKKNRWFRQSSNSKRNKKNIRIKEGDPLEIFTDKEGEVILKKYSPIGELSEFAAEYAETLTKTTGHIAYITDKDTVIAVSGASKKEWLEQGISQELEKILDNKVKYVSKENNDMAVPINSNEKKW